MSTRRLVLTALAAAALSACASPPARAIGSIVDVQVVDRARGETLTTWRHRGASWIAGRPGDRYAVRLTNRSGARVLVVLSVDGVNVVSGDTAAVGQTGYVLAPWQSAEITGWRKSYTEAAAFYFTALPDSYAARTDRPDNVGVIGAAVFRERVVQPVQRPFEPQPPVAGRRYEDSEANAQGQASSRLGADSAGAASDRPRAAPAAPAASPEPMRERDLAKAEKLGLAEAREAESKRAAARAEDVKRRALATAEAKLERAKAMQAKAAAQVKAAEDAAASARAAMVPAEMNAAGQKPAEMAAPAATAPAAAAPAAAAEAAPAAAKSEPSTAKAEPSTAKAEPSRGQTRRARDGARHQASHRRCQRGARLGRDGGRVVARHRADRQHPAEPARALRRAGTRRDARATGEALTVTLASKRSGALLLATCVLALVAGTTAARCTEEPAHSAALDEAIIKSAARHGVPESLVRRIVMRESKYNARARNHSYWGLMQISYPTAKSMGFRGSPQDLLNPIVNLRYAVPYLANAFIIAGKRQDAAVRLYASGYYDTARRRGLLGLLRTADSAPMSGVPEDPEVAAAAPAPEPEQSTGIFGALFGPQQMQRDPQTQQVVYASAEPQPAQVAPQAVLPGGKQGDEVALAADKHGDLQPPKKWQRDGGSTVIARGEQGIEKVAAYEKAAGTDDTDKGRHRSRKTQVFAALDQPPATAQAYAATAGSQDPRLLQAESQAAIQQATSGQAVPTAPAPAEPTQAAAPTPVAPVAEPAKSRKHRVARRTRHHDAPETAVAQAPDAAQPQAAAPQPQQDAQAPQPAPTEQAAAEPQQAAPQTRPAVDASGYPADAGGASQQAQADEPAPSKHKHHAQHRARPRKTAVAVQSPDDGKPQPTAQ